MRTMDALFSVLVRLCGDIDDAEEAVQDAFRAALERWPSSGIPPSPAGWIIATARNRAIDRHRRAPRCMTSETSPHSLSTSRATHSRRMSCATTGSVSFSPAVTRRSR